MPRYWKEQYAGLRYGDWPPETLPSHAQGLVIQELICVNVCSFTFKFYGIDEIREYIAFYEKKTHQSSILPIPPGSDSFFHWHSQRWYERLPLYLQEESKRIKVLKALRKALMLPESGKI
jgi:hypothetical protein